MIGGFSGGRRRFKASIDVVRRRVAKFGFLLVSGGIAIIESAPNSAGIPVPI
jgi:hypothetical protein